MISPVIAVFRLPRETESAEACSVSCPKTPRALETASRAGRSPGHLRPEVTKDGKVVNAKTFENRAETCAGSTSDRRAFRGREVRGRLDNANSRVGRPSGEAEALLRRRDVTGWSWFLARGHGPRRGNNRTCCGPSSIGHGRRLGCFELGALFSYLTSDALFVRSLLFLGPREASCHPPRPASPRVGAGVCLRRRGEGEKVSLPSSRRDGGLQVTAHLRRARSQMLRTDLFRPGGGAHPVVRGKRPWVDRLAARV